MPISVTNVASEREVSTPVVDLEHEQGPGQHQQVDEDAEEADRHEEMPVFRERRPKFPIAAPA